MPLNNYSVGRDVTLTIVTGSGPLVLTGVTGFKSKQETVDVESRGIDGKTRHIIFPVGWTGGFMIDRRDSTIDDYFAQLEANYYLGLNTQPIGITESIVETAGNVTQYRYTRVLLKLVDAGEWGGDKLVKMSLDFVAEQRIKIA
jgi:hypothetical protein